MLLSLLFPNTNTLYTYKPNSMYAFYTHCCPALALLHYKKLLKFHRTHACTLLNQEVQNFDRRSCSDDKEVEANVI